MSGKHLKNWDDLRIFLAVAKLGSFTRAAEQLQVVQTTVGRRMADLEKQVGFPLFQRKGRAIRLTPLGTEFANRAMSMVQAAQQIERQFIDRDSPRGGTVRITGTDGLMTLWLIPRLSRFHAVHPAIRIEVIASGAWGDLSSGEADIAFRYAQPTDKSVLGRKVGIFRFALYATQAYLDAEGTPTSMEALRRHRLIENLNFHINPGLVEWLGFLSRTPPIIATNSAAAAVAAVRAGTGIALLPTFYRAHVPDLVELDIPFRPECDLWLLANADSAQTVRVRAMMGFLEKWIEESPEWFA